jgi:pectate lyase
VTGAMAMQVTSAASAPQGTYTLSPLVSNVTAPGYAGSGSASYQVKAASGTFTDNFNRANAATLGNGWTQAAGTLSIQSSQAASATTRATHMAVQASVTGGTQTVQARFQSANNQVNPRLGVVLRYTNSQNYYLCYREVGSVSRVAIARVSGGAEKLLKSASVTNPGKSKFFTVACQAQGATLTLFLDGTKKATVSDSAFASGSVGMSVSYATSASGSRKGGATSSGAAHRIDDFSATTQ